ncbi:MAG: rod shape-determining protein RodA [Candidatus Zambryskibacteria bacterium]|nr:rod shape-determining protein RodA [Candidatus Zambryskibacteria bacterium]
MQQSFKTLLNRVELDWYLFIPALLLSLAGLITMNSFAGDNYFFMRQSVWILVSIIIFLVATIVDWRFLRRTSVLVPVFLVAVAMLAALLVAGETTRGVQSWFQFGPLAFQPSDAAKLIIILMLSKYFSRRHIEIKNVRHILLSGFYALIIFVLIFLQPDFGGAIVVFGIWLGMVLVSGISKKHLAYVALLGALISASLWLFVFVPYQKARILSFIHPLEDVRGAGYNAYQSTIAVGSGEIWGKGIGQGSQSKLQYLPEYETDFIFAAFAEEWGFVGTTILLGLCLVLLYRLVSNAKLATTNFETFFGLGVAILFALHIGIHAGMNMGMLPVTGITFPFMSYGGSHLLMEWLALGILSSTKRHSQGPRLL